ncbi:bacteriocin [Roseateles amylovorans]|uniref:Bacteriocin n=1 Tax=Roseateles amylovorans TaxID=2978473 RepID=A0ABY6B1M7_9BURK|nr:bacteriocin [Roseateles amylovorans]UXH77225.1 bacteriocin [Roseateles amylovorans]
MNASTPSAPTDKDLAEQARPGHGVPSQDPSPGAQYPLKPEEAERERNSVLAGGGVIVGVAAGAALGGAIAGPVGVVVGGTVGGVAGAVGGVAAGPMVNPDEGGDDKLPAEKPSSAA